MDEIGDWHVESRKSRYTIGYWLAFIFSMLGQTTTAPRLTYTLRNKATGEARTVEMSGTHSREELEAVVQTL